MSKKDFVLIAHIIDTAPLPPGVRLPLAKEFAEHLARINPKFDQIKFIQAATRNPAS
jgi:hypothetical protein